MPEMIRKKYKTSGENGFTLAELLIVVAIIAVLVAISIPVFTTQLEKAKQRTDEANARSAYGEAVADYLDDNKIDTTTITLGNYEFNATATETTTGGEASISVTSKKGTQSKEYSGGITYNGKSFSKTTTSSGGGETEDSTTTNP